MIPLSLSLENFATLTASASDAWPKEACGLIFLNEAGDCQIVPIPNMQDALHAMDPVTHPRTAAQAYAMDPLKVDQRIEAEAARGHPLVGIYHSHPQHPAYFSAMDQRAAMPFGVPTFPNAWQVVMGVFDAQVLDMKAFYWSDEEKRWLEGPIGGLPDLPGPPPGARRLDDA